MNDHHQNRSVESVALGTTIKYGGKLVVRYLPQLRIILSLILVRVGLKKTISFKFPHMVFASNWAGKFRLKSDTISFPGGVQMHRAIGIPEYDNSAAMGIMTFKSKKQ